MKKNMHQLPQISLVLALYLSTVASYCQTKEQALKNLEQTFATNLVKTGVYLVGSKDKTPSYFDYEIAGEYILIRESKASDASEFDKWEKIPYDAIDGLAPGDNKTIFKKQTVLQFQSTYGKFSASVGKAFESGIYYSTSINLPFNNADDLTIASIWSDIKTIVNAIAEEKKIAKQHSIHEKESNDIIAILTENPTMKAISLQPYSVFTSDSIMVNLFEHVEKSRKFKERPTVLVLYSNEWCNPCLRSIDTLLRTSTASTYNIVLVNIDYGSSLTKLNKKIKGHSPDYFTRTILVFDRSNQTQAIYINSAPMFLWFDKKLNIVGTYKGYDLTPATFDAVLKKIE